MNEATVWKGERLGQIGLENRLPSIALVQSVRRLRLYLANLLMLWRTGGCEPPSAVQGLPSWWRIV